MRMRYGFTTGSCAAAASKAAAYMLLTGKKKETISIVTPKGIVFEAKLLEITRKEKSVSCAVEKDGDVYKRQDFDCARGQGYTR